MMSVVNMTKIYNNILNVFKGLKLHQEEYVYTKTDGKHFWATFVKVGKVGKRASILELKVTRNYIIIDQLVKQLPSIKNDEYYLELTDYAKKKIAKGLQEIKAGKVTSFEDVKKEFNL